MNPRLLLALWLCYPIVLSGQSKISDKHFKITSATKESWSPGTVQDNAPSGGGLMYQIKLEVKKSGDFKFDSLITEAGALPLEVIKNAIRNYKGPLKKGERILLIAYQENQKSFTANSLAVQSLISDRKNQPALISYHVPSKKCLVRVGTLEKNNPIQKNQ
jgi:hypothetical protein